MPGPRSSWRCNCASPRGPRGVAGTPSACKEQINREVIALAARIRAYSSPKTVRGTSALPLRPCAGWRCADASTQSGISTPSGECSRGAGVSPVNGSGLSIGTGQHVLPTRRYAQRAAQRHTSTAAQRTPNDVPTEARGASTAPPGGAVDGAGPPADGSAANRPPWCIDEREALSHPGWPGRR
jgi:hypothetical protein